jgi:hypothetical protein
MYFEICNTLNPPYIGKLSTNNNIHGVVQNNKHKLNYLHSKL